MPPLRDDPTVRAFVERHPGRCAATTLTGVQCLKYQVYIALGAALFVYDWKLFVAALLFATTAFYAAVAGYKLLTIFISIVFRPVIRVREDELRALDDHPELLPVYTVLLPLYHEPNIAAKLLRAMAALDYPADRLDVKLLLEEDDVDTVERCRGLTLPPGVEMVVVPHALPKTKPKACNHGLERARGEYVVIFDAEDRPEPDQLKKAVVAFRRQPRRVACLQAKLNYYNPHQNWLTGFFTLEYTAWFDLFLPGLVALGVPVPLGGTSNHFRVEALRRVGGWDPFNLTEDCDLGIRLHEMGLRTKVLESTTWEEANARLGNWIRQRSRWVKGYFQTHLVHTRVNMTTVKRLGLSGFASFLLTVGGLSLSLLLNPIFWIVGLAYAGLWVGSAFGVTPEPWPLRHYDRVSNLPDAPLTWWSRFSWVAWFAAVSLAWANVGFVLMNVLAAARRKRWRLLPHALCSPFYWVLISVGAWKGFLQLFSRPFYWEKTKHGLDEDAAEPDLSAAL